ncbi:hypothetical protein V5O48_011998, partial [Marasmius crinis-equi]
MTAVLEDYPEYDLVRIGKTSTVSAVGFLGEFALRRRVLSHPGLHTFSPSNTLRQQSVIRLKMTSTTALLSARNHHVTRAKTWNIVMMIAPEASGDSY